MRISETAVGIIVTIGIWLSLVLLAWRIGLLVFNLCKKRSHRLDRLCDQQGNGSHHPEGDH